MGNGDQDRLKGKFHQAEGEAREQIGEWTGDEREQLRGQDRKAQGKAEEAGGHLKNAADDVKEGMKDAFGK